MLEAQRSRSVSPGLLRELGSLLPGIVGDVWRRRATGPKLTNTDGHRLRMITAHVAVNDPAGVGGTLAAHADFRVEDAGELSWWGRELSEIEREGALAQIRSLAGEGEPIEEPDEPQRWLRGRLEPKPDGFDISVNSDERLEALVELRRGLGAEPELGRRSVIDPAQDMPQSGSGCRCHSERRKRRSTPGRRCGLRSGCRRWAA